jgi:CheY-like chemotaxis protein
MASVVKLPPIIIVEDSDEDFDTVREAVAKGGLSAELRRATTGGECLTLLRGVAALRPAVVLMDLNTPGTDGREALATIKADPCLKAYPVVVFSTSADPRDLTSCYAAGANAFHVKPIRYPEHVQLIIDILGYWLVRVSLPDSGGTRP